MTAPNRLFVSLLRAVTAVAAALMILLGAFTLQNLTAHTDEPVSTLIGSAQQLTDDDISAAHIDQPGGAELGVCALMGLVILSVGAALAALLGGRSSRGALFQMARALAAHHPTSTFAPPPVSLTRLSVARI